MAKTTKNRKVKTAFLHLARIDGLLSCGSEAFDALPASIAGDETQGHGQGNIMLFEKACDLPDGFIRQQLFPFRNRSKPAEPPLQEPL